MFQDFKKFVMRGNVIDMAVGIVIGAAFGTIVKTFVSAVIMPPIGMLLGGVDFSNLFQVIKEGATPSPYATLDLAKEVGAVTINWGVFIDTIISFLIVAFAVFVVIRMINKMTEKEEEPAPEPTTKDCPFCFTTISIKATRCPSCTSEIKAA